MKNTFLERLQDQAVKLINVIVDKDKQYGSSWKQRGGVGAFMMFARKWDRIENAVTIRNEHGMITGYHDLFELARKDNRPEGILDDLEDLRNYLVLAIDEINVRKSCFPAVEKVQPKRDRTRSDSKQIAVTGALSGAPP